MLKAAKKILHSKNVVKQQFVHTPVFFTKFFHIMLNDAALKLAED